MVKIRTKGQKLENARKGRKGTRVCGEWGDGGQRQTVKKRCHFTEPKGVRPPGSDVQGGGLQAEGRQVQVGEWGWGELQGAGWVGGGAGQMGVGGREG